MQLDLRRRNRPKDQNLPPRARHLQIHLKDLQDRQQGHPEGDHLEEDHPEEGYLEEGHLEEDLPVEDLLGEDHLEGDYQVEDRPEDHLEDLPVEELDLDHVLRCVIQLL